MEIKTEVKTDEKAKTRQRFRRCISFKRTYMHKDEYDETIELSCEIGEDDKIVECFKDLKAKVDELGGITKE